MAAAIRTALVSFFFGTQGGKDGALDRGSTIDSVRLRSQLHKTRGGGRRVRHSRRHRQSAARQPRGRVDQQAWAWLSEHCCFESRSRPLDIVTRFLEGAERRARRLDIQRQVVE